jgi:hypothetical protein
MKQAATSGKEMPFIDIEYNNLGYFRESMRIWIDPSRVYQLAELKQKGHCLGPSGEIEEYEEKNTTFCIYFHNGEGNLLRTEHSMYYFNTKDNEEAQRVREFFEEIQKQAGPYFRGYQRPEERKDNDG